MHIRNNSSTRKSTAPDNTDDILYCRMAMLGLDLHAIESHDRETIDGIRQRCKNCEDREACAVDLERDPNNPVWAAYCPNSRTFNSLTEVWW
jgi:hypothetical protein